MPSPTRSHGGTKARESQARCLRGGAKVLTRQHPGRVASSDGRSACDSLRLLLGAMALSLVALSGSAEAKDSFKIAWSIYVGWMPWGWAADQGIVKKWADKYGITIDVVQINDYVELINQYTAGGFDGCVMTNMDALTIPAVGGVDSTALIVGDFSNGNDGIVSKTAKSRGRAQGRRASIWSSSASRTTCWPGRWRSRASPRRT